MCFLNYKREKKKLQFLSTYYIVFSLNLMNIKIIQVIKIDEHKNNILFHHLNETHRCFDKQKTENIICIYLHFCC